MRSRRPGAPRRSRRPWSRCGRWPAELVDSELARLDRRLPGLDENQRHEVARTIRRVVDKVLHTPTVRVKELAADPGGPTYADALRELFALDPATVDAVTHAKTRHRR